jgi:hypothetical protein
MMVACVQVEEELVQGKQEETKNIPPSSTSCKGTDSKVLSFSNPQGTMCLLALSQHMVVVVEFNFMPMKYMRRFTLIFTAPHAFGWWFLHLLRHSGHSKTRVCQDKAGVTKNKTTWSCSIAISIILLQQQEEDGEEQQH